VGLSTIVAAAVAGSLVSPSTHSEVPKGQLSFHDCRVLLSDRGIGQYGPFWGDDWPASPKEKQKSCLMTRFDIRGKAIIDAANYSEGKSVIWVGGSQPFNFFAGYSDNEGVPYAARVGKGLAGKQRSRIDYYHGRFTSKSFASLHLFLSDDTKAHTRIEKPGRLPDLQCGSIADVRKSDGNGGSDPPSRGNEAQWLCEFDLIDAYPSPLTSDQGLLSNAPRLVAGLSESPSEPSYCGSCERGQRGRDVVEELPNVPDNDVRNVVGGTFFLAVIFVGLACLVVCRCIGLKRDDDDPDGRRQQKSKY
jgi:hypothetical protein